MIFYFSATGNSRYLAQRIADGIGDDINDIAEEIKGDCRYHVEEGEKVGIVSPVYFYGVPTILSDFIGRMSFDGHPEFYLVLNFGTFPGTARDRFRTVMEENGHTLVQCFEVRMPENYVLMFDPPGREETESILNDADDEVERIIDILKSGKEESIITKNTLYRRMVSSFAYPFYRHGRGTRRFYADNKCMKCGKCVDLCPIGIIEMDGRMPSWKSSKCIRCCACINRCPHDAIQYGLSTRSRRRYKNPRV